MTFSYAYYKVYKSTQETIYYLFCIYILILLYKNLPPVAYSLEVSFAKAEIRLGACFNSTARAMVTEIFNETVIVTTILFKQFKIYKFKLSSFCNASKAIFHVKYCSKLIEWQIRIKIKGRYSKGKFA